MGENELTNNSKCLYKDKRVQELVNEADLLCNRELTTKDNPNEMRRLSEIRKELRELTIDRRKSPVSYTRTGVTHYSFFPKREYESLWSEWELT